MYLEIPEDIQAVAWQYARLNFTAANQWQGYLNYLCWQLSRAWFTDVTTFLDASEDDIKGSDLWEFVNGTPIAIPHAERYANGARRLCLIPHTTYDRAELRVPCEWVDIPGWIADYYLAVHIDLDACTATIWSYATHQQLQEQGIYDDLDRTYCVDADDLIQDLNLLPLALQRSSLELTRGSIGELKSVSLTEATRYLQIWSDRGFAVPRLDLPDADFPNWLTLIANEQWRRRLYQQRLGCKELVLELELS
jgi:hypothetical protein